MAEAHRDEIAKLEALYASNPEGRVFTHLAEAYRKSGDAARAREILTEGLRRHPDSASAYVVLGRVLSDSGDAEGGLDAFRRALELDTGNLVALRWCGDLALRSARVDDALGYYRELAARDPSDADLRERISIIEADRAAEMSSTMPTPPDSAPSELSFEPDTVHAGDAHADTSEAEGDSGMADFGLVDLDSGGGHDHDILGDHPAFDSEPLPGDLAAFAGRQDGTSWSDEADVFELDAGDLDTGDLDASQFATIDLRQDGEADAAFAAGETLDMDDFGAQDLNPDSLGIAEPAEFDSGFLDTGLLDGTFEASFNADADADAGSTADQTTAESLEEPTAWAEFAMSDDAAAFGEQAELAAESQSADTETESSDAAVVSDADYGWNPSEVEAAEAELPEPAATGSLDEVVEPGGFSDAVGGAVAEIPSTVMPIAPVTETMAELYRNQGFPERAADVYRQLLSERGPDARLEERLAEIEADLQTPSMPGGDAMVLDQDDAGEMWLRDEASPWVAGESPEATPDTPYAWGSQPDEGTVGAPIASYFQSLLSWKPAHPAGVSGDGDDALLLLDDASDASEELTLSDEVSADEAWSTGTDEVAADEPWSTGTDEVTADEPWSTGTDEVAADEPWSTGTDEVAADEPWSTGTDEVAPDEPWNAAADAPAQELMPWETATDSAPTDDAAPAPMGQAPASPQDAMPAAPASPQDADELMPWETGPAAAAPEGPVFDADPTQALPGPSDRDDEDGGGDDDEDLEMFRSWLQSLKK